MIFEIPESKRVQPEDIIKVKTITSDNPFDIFHKGHLKDSDIKVFIRESKKEPLDHFNKLVSIHGNLNHPTILPLLAFSYSNDDLTSQYVTPYMKNGNLGQLLQNISRGLNQSPISWNNTKILINIIGIARGMKYLHNNLILIRNLKPLNIMLDANLYPLIGDFYLSEILKEDSCQKYPQVGTPIYMAPEQLSEDNETTLKNDVYSFAMVLVHILTNEFPKYKYKYDFEKKESKLFDKSVIEGERPLFDEAMVPPKLLELIHLCWDADPNKRPSFDEIYSYIIKNLDTIICEFEDINDEEIEEYIKKIDC